MKMKQQVTKAVFPVAGLGTRFLPATKANPKEMLPIVDKPLIQYAVEEAIKAGIRELIFVTSSTKRAIEDHFDSNFELEMKLQEHNKQDLLKIVRDVLPKGVSSVYVRQSEALGLGHAVLCAKNLINEEPFAVMLADDLIDAPVGCLSQMVNDYERLGGNLGGVIAVQEIDSTETERYGIVGIKPDKEIIKIVEKPKLQDAPSNLGVVGRYVLSSNIFIHLEKTPAGNKGEIQLTDAIASLIQHNQGKKVYACLFDGVRYDCGSKLGYLEATVQYALKHPELADDFRRYLNKITCQ
jgi:UTP--glucose-1-phosphate uridylyltransferase